MVRRSAGLAVSTDLVSPAHSRTSMSSRGHQAAAVAAARPTRTQYAAKMRLPELPFACGLSTLELMAGDVSEDSLVPRAGSIAVRQLTVEPDLLDRWQAPADREQWWRGRVIRCHAVLLR